MQSQWRLAWTRILDERDKLSCAQSGSAGPPFSRVGVNSVWLAFARWFPWNWFSIDGTGWCFDSSWDEMRICSEIEEPVDWNGVSVSPISPRESVVADTPTLLQCLAFACLASAMARRFMVSGGGERYETQRRRASEESQEHEEEIRSVGALGVMEVLFLRPAVACGLLPAGRRERAALLALLSSALGLIAALWVPLPSSEDTTAFGMDVLTGGA